MSEIDFSSWTTATGDLDWGAQHVIHTALELAAEGKSSIVYGADYSNGGACLVNTVGQMLAVGGGSGIPSQHFGAMVREFDNLNRDFATRGINTDSNRMSPFAAEILLRNFGPMKAQPEPGQTVKVATNNREIIPERSDEEFASEWLAASSTDAINEESAHEAMIAAQRDSDLNDNFELSLDPSAFNTD